MNQHARVLVTFTGVQVYVLNPVGAR